MALIEAIGSLRLPAPNLDPSGRPAGPGFREMLESAVGQVERSRGEAARAVEQLLAGEGGELHTALLAVQKAELTLELFLEARNKILQGYQEIMRMQI
ncbi:MAG: flagellar hook-basal body complex protein FliE [Bryobacteraceae bacterium]|nr:flagellar hook-basal body complex protein FliE [Bryobacteraceae bacterium]